MKAYVFWDQRAGIEVTSSSATFGNELFSFNKDYQISAEDEQWGAPDNPHIDAQPFSQTQQQPAVKPVLTVILPQLNAVPDKHPGPNTNAQPLTSDMRLITAPPRNKTRRTNQIRDTDALLALAADEQIEFTTWSTALLAGTPPDTVYNPSFVQAMKGPHASEFKVAIAKEYASLKAKGVFEECTLPAGHFTLGTKMVHKIKETAAPDIPPVFKA